MERRCSCIGKEDMSGKPKHDYNIFTKDELVKFMKQNESNFRYIDTPYDIMLGYKMDETIKKMQKCSQDGKGLIERYQQGELDGIDYMIASMKHNDKYDKLSKEYDKLSGLRFGHLKV
jgi:hypothetical protein